MRYLIYILYVICFYIYRVVLFGIYLSFYFICWLWYEVVNKKHPREATSEAGKPNTKTRIRTYYDDLQVSRGANEVVIKASYKALAQKYHPDKNPGDSSAEAMMKDINEAYGVLSDPDARARYDASITQQESAPESEPSRPSHNRSKPQPSAPPPNKGVKQKNGSPIGNMLAKTLGAIMVAFCFVALILSAIDNHANDRNQQNQSQVSQQGSVTTPTAQYAPPPQTPTEEQLYNRAVDVILAKHPELDDKSPKFDQVLLGNVLVRIKEYRADGTLPHIALEESVAELESDQLAYHSQTNYTPIITPDSQQRRKYIPLPYPGDTRATSDVVQGEPPHSYNSIKNSPGTPSTSKSEGGYVTYNGKSRGSDKRDCLSLQTEAEIARCAGEK